MTNLAYPERLGYCRVTATVARALLDSADSDKKPDLDPLSGEVIIFTPTVQRVQHRGTPPMVLVMQPVEATIDAGGVLRGADNSAGVVLVASDDEALNPTGWAYTVSFKNKRLKIPPFTIPAPAGATIDLAALAPVADQQVSVFVADEGAAVRAEAAAGKAAREAANAQAAIERVESAAAQSARDAHTASDKAGEALAAQKAAEGAKETAVQTVGGFDQHAQEALEEAKRELSTKLFETSDELDSKVSEANRHATSARQTVDGFDQHAQAKKQEVSAEGGKQLGLVQAEGGKQVEAARREGQAKVSEAQTHAQAAKRSADNAAESAQTATSKAGEAVFAKDEVTRLVAEHSGIPGPKGERGPAGAPGAPGTPGRDGARGADGHTPTISMNGDQLTVDGRVVGPHLTGPRGAAGAAGTPGHNGSNGTPGKGIVNARTGVEMKLWHGSQSEYDRISFKDPNTLYFITA